jgi:tRNA(fMet)-specific endonuclease VapC
MGITNLCIDTSPLIAYLKGREPGATAVEEAVRQCNCFVTTITVYELLFGVARARKEIGEDALLGVMTIASFDEAAARHAARLHDQLIRANDDIGVKDVMIAAICLERSLPLLTLNERHFTRVAGLTVFTPETLRAAFV